MSRKGPSTSAVQQAWKKRLGWIITDKSYTDYDGINGEPTEFERNIFPGFTALQLCGKVTDPLSRSGETPETFTGRILFMSMFNDISCDSKGNEEECLANAKVVPIFARKFGIGQWSFMVQGPRRSGILWKGIGHKESGTKWRTECCWNLQKADIPFSVQQLHCPGVSSKAKDTENCRFTIVPIRQQLRLFFRIIVSVNQLSLYGAVANMCEECKSFHDRSGQPDVVMGQSVVLSEIKAEVPLENDNIPSHHQILWQRYEERIKSLSQTDRVSKFCMDAGFTSVV